MGSDGVGFSLYYSSGVKRWVFLWSWYESGVRKYVSVNSDATGVPLQTWTHLAGSYDAEDRTVRLYVNGQLQGSPVTAPAISDATVVDGALQFGREYRLTSSAYVNYWRGRVDEVAVWQRQLTDDEIATEARLLDANGDAETELVADWNPVGASGTTSLADGASGYARSLALAGGASLDGEGIVLDGTNDAASTSGPVVDDTGSFTVSTDVALNRDVLLNKSVGYTGQVLGQRSADGSAWGLWYTLTGFTTTLDDDFNEVTVPAGFWEFGRLNADGGFSSVQSDEVAETGSPVRLTGVFDAQSAVVHLYLGSSESGDEAGVAYTAVMGSGDFAVGKGFAAGDTAWGHYLPAAITDIRIWAGAMADQDQVNTEVGIGDSA
jgi:hypothetical protein